MKNEGKKLDNIGFFHSRKVAVNFYLKKIENCSNFPNSKTRAAPPIQFSTLYLVSLIQRSQVEFHKRVKYA